MSFIVSFSKIYGFQVGPKFRYKFEVFGKLYVQSGDKFQSVDDLGTFQVIKITFVAIDHVYISVHLCLGHCV